MSGQLRERFVEANGYWSPAWQALMDEDPGFFATFVELAAVPQRSDALDPKVKELVCVAVNSAATHLFEPGIRAHVRRALELGATKEELLEVLQLTSTLGIHASTVGVPLLLEALGESDSDSQSRGDTRATTLDDRRAALKADFEAKRGYWHGFWDGLLELDPDFFEAYVDFSAFPWENGVLEPKVKELIYTAFDASATHMYVPGLRQHIENALGYGATPAEVMEVFELASTIGIHGYLVGLPILLEELERAERGG
ncbi:MAG: carboxymuconolactone decarboxylase family protein [Verrucomicrobiota bacterium]